MSKQTGEKSSLIKNTVYLYLLTFSSQAISLLTVPYQTRVLSPETYGIIGYIVSLMTILSLIVNFGFLYSATQSVTKNHNNRRTLSAVYTDVFLIKVLLGIISFPAFLLVGALSLKTVNNIAVFVLYYLAYWAGALLPDYLYRGLEKMKTITLRTVCIRMFSAISILLLMKSEEDVVIMPLSLLICNIAALVFSFRYDRYGLGISFIKTNPGEIITTAKESLPFFVSRIASTVYQGLNAVVLGSVYPGQAAVGWYSAADKGLSVIKQVSSPVADSLYPYMIRTKDYKSAIRILLIAAIPITMLCIFIWFEADQICALVFGESYGGTGDVLRCMIPAIAVIFPTYIVCFPILVPMGLSEYANKSNVVGLVVQVASLVLLFATAQFNVYTLTLAASLSESVVFLYRLSIMIKYRDRMKLTH